MKLEAGGPAGTSRWLYPYDGTVFPRGTAPPLVMWHSDGAPDAVYFHMYSNSFDYKGALVPALNDSLFIPQYTGVSTMLSMIQQNSGAQEAKTQLAIPKQAWDAAGEHSQGSAGPFTLELTERVAGTVRGPFVSHIVIAQAAFKGSIYYQTCFSSTGTLATSNGPIARTLRIPPSGNAELLQADVGLKCVGCHSVSADGSRVLAQRSTTSDDAARGTGSPEASVYALSYQLGPDGKPDASGEHRIGQPSASTADPWGAFGALYRDGSKFLSTSGLVQLAWSYASPLVAPATLYDTTTGAAIADTGVPPGAAMPSFSPDGKHLVFTDQALGNAHGLAMMDYDMSTNKATNYRVLVQYDANATTKPGWPMFLPDNAAVVFLQTPSADFSGSAQGGASAIALAQEQGTVPASKEPSDLYMVDIATGKVTMLAKAMGFNTPMDANNNQTYLPFGTEDIHFNYYPAVSPVAAGGYFWLFFESYRHFGSLGPMRVLYGTALDIRSDGNYALDPSHPAFYLPGQEFFQTSHFRAVAALDRCQQEGGACKTAIDCCTGVCSLPPNSASTEFVDPVGTCGPPRQDRCAARDERCDSQADCCNLDDACINGICAEVPLL